MAVNGVRTMVQDKLQLHFNTFKSILKSLREISWLWQLWSKIWHYQLKVRRMLRNSHLNGVLYHESVFWKCSGGYRTRSSRINSSMISPFHVARLTDLHDGLSHMAPCSICSYQKVILDLFRFSLHQNLWAMYSTALMGLPVSQVWKCLISPCLGSLAWDSIKVARGPYKKIVTIILHDIYKLTTALNIQQRSSAGSTLYRFFKQHVAQLWDVHCYHAMIEYVWLYTLSIDVATEIMAARGPCKKSVALSLATLTTWRTFCASSTCVQKDQLLLVHIYYA